MNKLLRLSTHSIANSITWFVLPVTQFLPMLLSEAGDGHRTAVFSPQCCLWRSPAASSRTKPFLLSLWAFPSLLEAHFLPGRELWQPSLGSFSFQRLRQQQQPPSPDLAVITHPPSPKNHQKALVQQPPLAQHRPTCSHSPSGPTAGGKPREGSGAAASRWQAHRPLAPSNLPLAA